jgi:phosphatidylethanolamine-binding protein (PEBP) family uncharacterized protein
MTVFVEERRAALFALAAALFGWPYASLAQDALELVPTWDGIKACSGKPITSPSPAFTLNNVPKGTTTLEFKMTDLEAPHFNHGGGRIAYGGGNKVNPGAFQFTGPCPPSTHRYEWTVTALDSRNRKLAFARAVKNYP